jgi:hypothetical protein
MVYIEACEPNSEHFFHPSYRQLFAGTPSQHYMHSGEHLRCTLGCITSYTTTPCSNLSQDLGLSCMHVRIAAAAAAAARKCVRTRPARENILCYMQCHELYKCYMFGISFRSAGVQPGFPLEVQQGAGCSSTDSSSSSAEQVRQPQHSGREDGRFSAHRGVFPQGVVRCALHP